MGLVECSRCSLEQEVRNGFENAWSKENHRIHNTIKTNSRTSLKDGLVDEICGPEEDIVMLAKTGYELRDKCPTLG
jgi:hypothetical protein